MLLLQTWMQSDKATISTAERAQELMKASQVTKVTSTPAHPRGNGLVERAQSLYVTQDVRLG